MATMEERMKILTMLQEGKITAEDAAQLLEAISQGSPPAGQRRPGAPMPPGGPMPGGMPDVPGVPGRKPRWLRVRVTDNSTGRPKVNVRLPVSMVGVGLKMGSKFAPQIEGVDAEQLMQMIEEGEVGQIVDVYDEDDGEHVEVFLE